MRVLLLLMLWVAAPASAQYDIDTRLPSCANLRWSEAVHRAYPDIQNICQGIYQRDGRLYAKAGIEVVRTTGNRITIRTLHNDGTTGHQRTLRVPPDWRASIDGREYRVGELLAGQQLTVYIPRERFDLLLDADQSAEPLASDEASATAAP